MHICCRAEFTSRRAAHVVLSRPIFKGLRFPRRSAHARLPLDNILFPTCLCGLNGVLHASADSGNSFPPSFPSSIQNSSSVTVSFPLPAPSLPSIVAEGKHSYDLEYQLPTEAP